MKLRTLNDHKNHYRYLQRWLAENHPTLKLKRVDRRPRSPVSRAHADGTNTVRRTPDARKPQHHQRPISRNREHPDSDAQADVRQVRFSLETVVSPRIILPAEIIENSCDTSGDMLFRPRDLSERALLELFIEAKGKGVFRTGFLNDLREMINMENIYLVTDIPSYSPQISRLISMMQLELYYYTLQLLNMPIRSQHLKNEI